MEIERGSVTATEDADWPISGGTRMRLGTRIAIAVACSALLSCCLGPVASNAAHERPRCAARATSVPASVRVAVEEAQRLSDQEGDVKRAYGLLWQAGRIIGEEFARHEFSHSPYLQQMTVVHCKLNDGSGAERLLDKVTHLCRPDPHRGSSRAYARSLYDIAAAYRAAGVPAKAKQSLLRAAEAVRACSANWNSDCLVLASDIDSLCCSLGDYHSALIIDSTLCDRARSWKGEVSWAYAWSLDNLAQTHECFGSHEKARPLRGKVSEICSRVSQEGRHGFIAGLMDLISLLGHDYPKMLATYRLAMEFSEEAWGADSVEYASALRGHAALMRYTDEADEAEAEYRKAIDIFEKSGKTDGGVYLATLNELASLLYGRGSLAEAKQLYGRAVQCAEKMAPRRVADHWLALVGYADSCLSAGQGEEALASYRKAVEMHEALRRGRYLPGFAECVHRCADLYDKRGDRQNAKSWYRRAKEVFEASGETEHLSYVFVVINLACYASQEVKRREAIQLCVEAGRSLDRLERNEHRDGVSALQELTERARAIGYLGETLLSLGENNGSERRCRQAAELLKQVGLAGSADWARFTYDHGVALQGVGRYRDAETVFRAAKSAYDTLGQGVAEPGIYCTVGLCASLYSQGRYSGLDSLLAEALGAARRCGSTRTLAHVLYNRARLSSLVGHYREAVAEFGEAAKGFREAGDETGLARCLVDQVRARTNVYTADPSESESLCDEALAIIARRLGEENSDYVSAISLRGNLYRTRGRFREAKECYDKAMQLGKRIKDGGGLSYASRLNDMAIFYHSLCRYVTAERYYLEAVRVRKAGHDEASIDYAMLLSNLAWLYSSTERADMAIDKLSQALDIIEKSRGKGDPHYNRTLNLIGDVLCRKRDFRGAAQRYTEVVSAHPDSVECAHSLLNLGWVQTMLGNAEEGKRRLGQAREMMREDYGGNVMACADALTKLGCQLSEARMYDEAESSLDEAIELYLSNGEGQSASCATAMHHRGLAHWRKSQWQRATIEINAAREIWKTQVGVDSSYANMTCNLAMAHMDAGEYDVSETLLRAAVATYKAQPQLDRLSYANALSNLGLLCSKLDRFMEAESLYEEADRYFKAVLGESTRGYAVSLNNRALVCDQLGAFGEADLLYRRAIGIWEARHLTTDPMYALGLNNLGALYSRNGLYVQAEEHYRKAREVYANLPSPDYPNYALATSNLGGLCREQGRFAEAKELLSESLDLRRKVYGEKHPQFADGLLQLASLGLDSGELGGVEQNCRQVIDLLKELNAGENLAGAGAFHNLGVLYLKTGRLVEAEASFLEALRIGRKVLGAESIASCGDLSELSSVCAAQGDWQKAADHLSRALDLQQRHFCSSFSALSGGERLEMKRNAMSNLDVLLTIAVRQPSNEQITRKAFDWTVRRKALVIKWVMQESRLSRLTGDSPPAQVRRQLLVAQKLLVEAPKSQEPSDQARVRRLGDEVERLQKRLSDRGTDVHYYQETMRADVQTVGAALGDGKRDRRAALLDLVSYRPLDFRSFCWQEERYACWVLVADWQGPTIIDLGPRASIDESIRQYRRAMEYYGKCQRSFSSEEARSIAKRIANRLYRAIWAKILPALSATGVERIYIVPDGELSLLPFGAMLDDTGKYLVQAYEFTYLVSSRDLLRKPPARHSDRLAIFAAPDCGRPEPSSPFAFPNETSGEMLNEAKSVTEVCAGRLVCAGIRSGREASRDAFLKTERPCILHLALHGFYSSSTPRSVAGGSRGPATVDSMRPEESMYRSGLALCDANVAGRGVVTAAEIAQMDLSGAMVVVSACQSGLGEVESGEGVSGLRSAFHVAGASETVSALWSIPNQVTPSVMRAFYKDYLVTNDAATAITRAQRGCLAAKGLEHPFYWGAFVATAATHR